MRRRVRGRPSFWPHSVADALPLLPASTKGKPALSKASLDGDLDDVRYATTSLDGACALPPRSFFAGLTPEPLRLLQTSTISWCATPRALALTSTDARLLQ